MPMFLITNTNSGHTIGEYIGETALDAYQEMMRDAGYRDAEHAASAGLTFDTIPDDISILSVREVL